MDDSILKNSFLDLDLQEQNYVNPDIACRFEIYKQPPPQQIDIIMLNRIPLNVLVAIPQSMQRDFYQTLKLL